MDGSAMTGRLLLLAGVLFGTAAAMHATGPAAPAPQLARPLAQLPAGLGEWTAVRDHVIDEETRAVLRADDHVARLYAGPGGAVDLFVGYYRTQQAGATIHSPVNCLPGTGWQLLDRRRTHIDAGTRTIESNVSVIQKGLDKRLVFYWYQSYARTVASEYAAKLYLVLDSLRHGRSDAALVRVIVPYRETGGEADRQARRFVRELIPALDRHLPR